MRALDQGTSVNALLRDYLTSYAGTDELRGAMRRLLELSEASPSGSGPQGRTWTRDSLHER